MLAADLLDQIGKAASLADIDQFREAEATSTPLAWSRVCLQAGLKEPPVIDASDLGKPSRIHEQSSFDPLNTLGITQSDSQPFSHLYC